LIATISIWIRIKFAENAELEGKEGKQKRKIDRKDEIFINKFTSNNLSKKLK